MLGRPVWLCAALVVPALLLAGCGGLTAPASAPSPVKVNTAAQGSVFGGQQPVVGAAIQLYSVGTTGDGSAATPLMAQPAITNANGNFNLNAYDCTGTTEVYAVATGGSSLNGLSNPNLVLMDALGSCANIATEFIALNELTTVAATSALSPYAASATSIGSGTSDASALAAAFTLAGEYVNPNTGQTPGTGVPSNMSVPTTQIITLGDIVAACVNSAGGTAGTMTLCGQLFTLTTPPGGTAPSDTVQALLDLAQNPMLNTPQLFGLVAATSPPYQTPATIAPPDFRVRLMPSAATGYVLQVAPASLAFPLTAMGSPSDAETAVISNSGSSALTLSAPAIIGQNAAEFQQTSTCGSSLAANAQCLVSLTFSPQATGSRSAYLEIASNSPNSPQYVQLSGTGAGPATPAPLGILTNRGVMTIAGVTSDVTLTNQGTAALTISGVSLLLPTSTVTHNCPASLAPGASCTASIHNLLGGANQLTFTTNDPLLLPEPFGYPGVVLSLNVVQLAGVSDLYFPPTLVGSSSTTQFSQADFNNPLASLTGPNASDFSLSSGCNGSPASTCIVTFKPSAAGQRSASMAFGNSAPYFDYLPIQGIGITSAPATTVTLTPSSLLFKDSVAPQTVTLTNPQNNAVNLQPITIQTTPGQVEFTESDNCGSSLPAQSICTITIATARRSGGGTESLLNVTGDFGSLYTALQSADDPPFDFGYTLLGQSASGYPVFDQARNTATVSESFSGTNAGDFSSPGCMGSGVIGQCTAMTTFTPHAAGLRTTQGTIMATGDTTYNGFFLGTGTSVPTALFSVTQGGYVDLPTVGPYNIINIRNLGTAAATISSITTSGTQGVAITPTSDACTGTVLTQSATCVYEATVSAPATATGVLTTNLIVTDSVGHSTSVPVYFNNGYPGPQVSSTSITFPNTAVGDVSSPVSITVTPTSGYGAYVYTPSTPEVVATKSSCSASESPCVLTFVFVPKSPTLITYGNSIFNSSGEGGTAISLTGTGTTPVMPGAASVNPTSLTFPARPVNSTSIAQNITLSNTGSGPFNITSLGFSGAQASEYSLSTTCGSSVTAGNNCAISVTFAPTVSGSANVSLVINGDANAGLPLSVPITGSAQ